ncbi:MAG: hypothetical protein NVS3B20_24470 [Polyangiales bacterium]
MEALLARLERKLGRFAIPNLITYVVGLTALVYVLDYLRPGYMEHLVLDPERVRHGELWRVITFAFIPGRRRHPIFLFFALQMLWIIGKTLEAEWGAFKLNVYYFIGVLGTAAAAMAVGLPMTGYFINLSLFLAFATLFPDYQIYVFFVLPVRVKWLGLLAFLALLYAAITSDLAVRIALAVALFNFFLFFGKRLLDLARGIKTVARQGQVRAQQKREADAVDSRPKRVCVLCGLSDGDEGADLRVCTCSEVCHGKATIYCLPHARSHNKQPAV